jgi:hypothetical protein
VQTLGGTVVIGVADVGVVGRILVAPVVVVGGGAVAGVVAGLTILGEAVVFQVQVVTIGVHNVVNDVETIYNVGIEALDAGWEFDGLPLGKEARVKEARLKMKKELEGGEARKEASRSAAEVGHGGMAYERECAKEWVNYYL